MLAPRERLDVLLVARGLFETRERAQAAVLAGQVFVAGQRADKPGHRFPTDVPIEVRGDAIPYVSRGGLKLAHALDVFGVDPAGRVALDVGASTGGFTDVLLQRGASHVIAVDVGYGQLAWKLRADPRVTVLDRTNIRHLRPDRLPYVPDLAVVDVSFISLAKVLPHVAELLAPGSQVIALVKPQFEAGPRRVGRGGIVHDPEVHRAVLRQLATDVGRLGWHIAGLTPSPVLGAEGNIEFLAHLLPGQGPPPDVDEVVAKAHARP